MKCEAELLGDHIILRAESRGVGELYQIPLGAEVDLKNPGKTPPNPGTVVGLNELKAIMVRRETKTTSISARSLRGAYNIDQFRDPPLAPKPTKPATPPNGSDETLEKLNARLDDLTDLVNKMATKMWGHDWATK